MGLRCLIGHDFGEVQTDRDREERGDEVVVTVREFRECARCGETRVLSENKEVRTTATSASADEDDPGDQDGTGAGAGGDLEDVDAEEDDGVILQETSDEDRERGEWPEEDGPDPDRPGEDHEPWPEDDGEEAVEPTADHDPWPEVEGEDEGYDAEPGTGDAAEGVDFSGGLTPERTAADTEAVGDEVIESGGDPGSSGIRRAGPSPAPTGRQREEGSDAELFCPECGHRAPSDGSSLRPGDICPECRLGYLTERSD